MNVFVAGATGVLGKSAVAALVAAGHNVTGVTRTEEKARSLRALGAEVSAVDIFEPTALTREIDGHDAVCNFATRIPRATYFFRSAWNENSRLHRDLSRLLVDAAIQTGATRYLQHSAAFMYADGGDQWLDEDSTLAMPPHGQALMEAEANARRFTERGGAGIAMRFGFFYGPAAPSARDLARIGRLGFVPFPGRADAYLPWIHADDLGTSMVAALSAPAGTYNVCDDQPLTRADLGRALAEASRRKKPLRTAPAVLTRLMGKRYDYMSRSQRVSNARFKEVAGWSPTFPSSLRSWPSVTSRL
ncbi:MAG: NAD(P)-dependent oxidoreductase [Actinomycetota bacterium]